MIMKVNLYSVLLWSSKHLPIRYRHRQSRSTAYRLQARPALTGPGLWLTAIPRPGLLFNGGHPSDPCITWITTHLPTTEGRKAELAYLVDQ